MKKLITTFFALIPLMTVAEELPLVSGKVLYQIQADKVAKSQKTGMSSNNGFLYIEPNISFNINNNWSIKNQLRFQPNSTLTTRDQQNPERYRTFLADKRNVTINNNGVLLEEIKLQYENEDMKFSIGKLDPTFGTAHRKTKRIGVFTSQFTEDYNLREKIGFNITGLLEDAQISLNSFFNDTTKLSNSAIDKRGEASDNFAGANRKFSSYSLNIEGDNLFSMKNWFYNIGYRSLAVKDSQVQNTKYDRENGIVIGSEYNHKLGKQTSVIPFVEVAHFKNYSGIKNRTASYAMVALIGKYSSWTASSSYNIRRINNKQILNKETDKQLQFSVGYKFTNNIALDVSRANIKESGYNATLIGANLSYLYEF